MEDNSKICPLCQREIAEPASLHHLLPRSQGGKQEHTVLLHQICHSKIHSVFTEKELAKNYSSIPQLLASEEIAKFVKWVSSKPANYHDRNDRHSRKK